MERLLFVALVMLLGAIPVAAVSCGEDSGPTPASQRASPPLPPPAPESVARKVADILQPGAAATPTPASGDGGEVDTEITVINRDPGGSTGGYRFDPNEFTFSAGETVELTITAETEFHTFTVDDLGIDVSIDGGETATLVFTFDTPGTFRLICIPHEAFGMVGAVTVQ